MTGEAGTGDDPPPLELADWRRRVGDLYAEVRTVGATDPRAAWERWSAVREELFRVHPQSPVPPAARRAFRARHWPYDPRWRLDGTIVPDAPGDMVEPAGAAGLGGFLLELPQSVGDAMSFRRIGSVRIDSPLGPRSLGLFWMAGYAGGLFLPFRDATNGSATYGAGRYLLDTAKGADLGGDVRAGHLVLDFNFAFQPSCAFDPRWSCPLAPPENRLDIAVEAGERIA